MPTATGSSSTRLSLISRVASNDSKAWQDLVELYSPLIAFWCRKGGVCETEINDTIQEVFFSVSRSIDKFQPSADTENRSGFRGWLWTITRNKIIDSARRSARFPAANGGSTAALAVRQIPDLPHELDVDDESERTEYSSLLHRALEQVREEFQPKSFQAFWRSTIDSVPVAQVAQELGITNATVRQHRSRILRRLRQQLGELE